MTKREVVDFICKNNKKLKKKNAANTTDIVFNAIKHNVKTNKKFSYPGFGTFIIRNRKARKGRNPRTGEEIDIKASQSIGFRPAKAFKMDI